MNQKLFSILKETGGMYIPLYQDVGGQQNLRYEYGTPGATFPTYLKREQTVPRGGNTYQLKKQD